MRQLAQFGLTLPQALVGFGQFGSAPHNPLFKCSLRLLQGVHRRHLGP